MAVPVPDFLFEIEYSSPANAKFYETKGERDLIYAFHGSRLENFHSIIHNGLHCHLNKVGPKPSAWGAQNPGEVAGGGPGGVGLGSLGLAAHRVGCRPAPAAAPGSL